MQGLAQRPSTLDHPRAASVGGDSPAIGYLGGKTDHCENITRLLASVDRQVIPLPDSTTGPLYKASPRLLAWKPASILWRKSIRVLGQLHGTRDSQYVRNVVELIDHHGLECVIAYWSTAMLGDLIAIKRLRPKVKLILNILCHPLGLTPIKVALQNWHFRRSVPYLDGLILPSEAMKTYLDQHVIRGRRLPCLKWPPYYSQHFFPVERQAPCPTTPNLLFLGRMDYYRAQPSDDVRSFVEELLDQGVHVYHHAADGNRPHPNRHTFQYLPLQKAEEYATAFDASLILYNLKACKKTERFNVTVPDRLVASVTAGIPIAIPSTGYSASMEYLQGYDAVLPFTSAADLAQRLSDRGAMARFRLLAQEQSRNYIGEQQLAPLLEFMQRVVHH